MATHGWGTDFSLAEQLFREGYRFDFFQAVRLLERLYPDRASAAEDSRADREAVRFSASVGFDFPPGEIAGIMAPESEGDPAKMIVHFIGLAGNQGPLPAPYTELILKRQARQDKSLKAFLDLFNHRIISLMYRIRKIFRIGFDLRAPDENAFSRYLFSLFGMGTRHLAGKMALADRALLFHAGLLAQRPPSLSALTTIIADLFKVEASVVPMQGRWCPVAQDQITRIGFSGANQILGESALLGTRVWDQQASFTIQIRAKDLQAFNDLLPAGNAFAPLCHLIRFYVGPALDFSLRLELAADRVPQTRLTSHGLPGAPRLGWTSWLKSSSGARTEGVVILSMRQVEKNPWIQRERVL